MDNDTGPVLYAERGASWWPLLWGPVFAVLGVGVELLTGPVSVLFWSLVAFGLLIPTALWVQGRQRLYSVRLTPAALSEGREVLRMADVAAVEGVEPRSGATVLGTGWNVPKGTTAVPIRLVDGTVVLGWARDPDALRAALHRLLTRT
ncbi:MAG TPA: hypothetical protein VNO31_35725 [Umezawaea sp.]|nr:hypothetical protein [Umezawaea sp.]